VAWNVHCRQPLSARNACTTPPALPTNTCPPMTVGCANAEMSPSKPNAHFNFNRGTCAVVSFATAAGANRALSRAGLQPFHALAGTDRRTLRSGQYAAGGGVGSGPGLPRKAATASRSSRRSV
jgi:hypothetical protein